MVMQCKTEVGLERLNKVLINDKYVEPNSIIKVLKSDILHIISSYMDYLPETCEVNIEVNELGEYDFNFFVSARRIKMFGMLPK